MIGLVVDHPLRDLPGLALVAYHLARRGERSVLLPMYTQAVDAALLGVDTVVVNYVRPNNLDLLQGYLADGRQLFVLDTEGGASSVTGGEGVDVNERRARETGVGPAIAGYFVWGERIRGEMLGRSGIPDAAFEVTGCPRYDFCAPRWRGLLRPNRTGYVLANCNHTLANSQFSDGEARETEVLVDMGYTREQIRALFAAARRIFRNFVEEFPHVARALPDTPFLVRPHPFERMQSYQEAFAGLSNVTIDKTGSVVPVIAGARAVLHINCGTSVEATMLGKLPISLEYLNDRGLSDMVYLPSRLSFQVHSREALVATLRDIDGATAAWDFDSRYRAHVWPSYYEADGAAAERVAAGILARRRPGRPPARLGPALRSSRPAPRIGQRLQGLAAVLAGSAAAERLRASRKPARRAKQIDAAQIDAMLAGYAALEGIPAPTAAVGRHPFTGMALTGVEVRPA